MHGILFKSLKDFVVERHDRETWDEIQASADLAGKVYLPIEAYDDGELRRLVEAASERTGRPVQELLESFGRYAAGRLLETYGNVAGEAEGTLDLVLDTEARIHSVLRARDAAIDPPRLTCRRDGDAVRVEYRSARNLCSVAKGIARGVGDHYDQAVVITEEACMREGDDHCELVVHTE